MKKAKRKVPGTKYSMIDVLMASSTEPMPQAKQDGQMAIVHRALHNIETADKPTLEDWRTCSDIVNMMSTLINENGGWWPGCDGEPIRVVDASGLLNDAVSAMRECGLRYTRNGVLRFDGPGLQAVKAVIDDYQMCMENLPQRAMVRCHMLTEIGIKKMLQHNKQQGVTIL